MIVDGALLERAGEGQPPLDAPDSGKIRARRRQRYDAGHRLRQPVMVRLHRRVSKTHVTRCCNRAWSSRFFSARAARDWP